MATNLVSLVMQFLTPSMISKIASSLGMDQSDAQKAVGVGVPAILAGLANAASKPQNQQALSSTMMQQSSMLDQIKSAISGGSGAQVKSLADSGGSLLSSLLGGEMSNMIAGAVGRFAGINPGTSASLLGMLAPLVTGLVGQEQRSAGLDAKGLANMLTSQGRQITSAMPASFSNMLGSTGVLDNLEDGWRRGAAAASSAADHVSDMAGRATSNAGYVAAQAGRQAAASSSNYWPYLGAGLLALLGLSWFMLGSGDNSQTVADRTPSPVTRSETVGAGTPDAKLSDITAELNSSVNAARSALQSIADPVSARDALPKLQQVSDRIDNINRAVSQLPASARQGLSIVVAQALPALNQLCDKVLASPQTGDVAKPAIDALRAKLDALARSS